MTFTKKIAHQSTYAYIIALVLISVLPINGKDSYINKTYFTASEIRLDYLLHSILLIPWMLLRILYEKTDLRIFFQWLAIGVLLAIAVELIQYILPYRTYNIIDLMANIIGVFIGLLFWAVIKFPTKQP